MKSEKVLDVAKKAGEYGLLVQLQKLSESGDRLNLVRHVMRTAIEAEDDAASSKLVDIFIAAMTDHVGGTAATDHISGEFLMFYGGIPLFKGGQVRAFVGNNEPELVNAPLPVLTETKKKIFTRLATSLRYGSDETAELVARFLANLPQRSVARLPTDQDICVEVLKEVTNHMDLSRIHRLLLVIEKMGLKWLMDDFRKVVFMTLWKGYVRRMEASYASNFLKVATPEILGNESAFMALQKCSDEVSVLLRKIPESITNPRHDPHPEMVDRHVVRFWINSPTSVSFYVLVNRSSEEEGVEALISGLFEFGKKWLVQNPGYTVGVYCLRASSCLRDGVSLFELENVIVKKEVVL